MDQDEPQRYQYSSARKKEIEAWWVLTRVCRRWRSVIFGSPCRLNMQLVCTTRTPAKDVLDIWPPWPLIIHCDGPYQTEAVDNVIVILERSDRVRQIILEYISGSPLAKVLAAMQVPFPELTRLEIESYDKMVPVLADSFLGEFAPRLQELRLRGIPFPGLRKLLLSATHLVEIHLCDIPHSGYILPEVIATALSTLTSLASLSLEFRLPRPHPDHESRRPPPSTRPVLLLTSLTFKGVGEYLDDLVARIDAPRLCRLSITLFNDIVFDTPRLVQFIGRIPTLKALKKAEIKFGDDVVGVDLSSQTSDFGFGEAGELSVKIPCKDIDWQLSALEQVFTSCLPPLSMLENLYIFEPHYSRLDLQDNIESTLWLDLLGSFTTVKNVFVSEKFAPRIVPALQELVDSRTTEVLPTLQNIFLEGNHNYLSLASKSFRRFVAARQATGHHTALFGWTIDYIDRDYFGSD